MTFIIEDWTEPVKVNPYNAHVAALINAGEGKVVTLIVPIADKLKVRTEFAAAANAQERTARVKVNEAGKDEGTWLYKFALGPKNAPRRNKAREDAAKALATGHAFKSEGKECEVCKQTLRFHAKAVTVDNVTVAETVHIDATAEPTSEPTSEPTAEPTAEPTPTPKPRNTRKRS